MNQINTFGENSVAIMLATYNGAENLEEQIFSILWQTHGNFRLYVRDDGSTDKTQIIINKMASLDSRIEILPSSGKYRTGSAACNFLKILCEIDPSRHSYFSFADQDDIWAPKKLEAGIMMLKETHSSGYSSNMLAYDAAKAKTWYVRKNNTQKEFDYLFQAASAGCTYIFDRKLFDKTRVKIMPLLESMPKLNSHDWIVYAIARSSNLKWIMDGRAYIFYRQHATNVYGSKTGMGKILSKLSILQSGWYREHVLWNQKIIDNSPDEMLILGRVKADSALSRFWIAIRSMKFRRSNAECLALILLILSGLFYKNSKFGISENSDN